MMTNHPGRPETGYENAKLERAYLAELAAAQIVENPELCWKCKTRPQLNPTVGLCDECNGLTADEDSEIETIDTVMRAKLQIGSIEPGFESEILSFHGVCKTDAYPADGLDEDNSFARWSPSVRLDIVITNPALIGKFAVGQKFYCDFSLAEK
jgi:hypothetical protein